ncbi:MAG: 3-dehydroquinate synthase [Fibromonadaceae bacterium]|jgi:3-dehydroquinate synthase/shikimate kinase/3-dehydroquinate synthase|nr:3-dehydroquinate synthase [Fibromonadaceae bacterium]
MLSNIYFTGFMASGKTRIGKLLAETLNLEYIDSDVFITEKAEKSIAEIFEQEGEAKFRELEKEAIREISQKKNTVVSLGGGAVTQLENVKIIKDSGILICMEAQPEILSERIGRNNKRPLMANLEPEERIEKIKTMLAEREKFYSVADFSVESNEDPPEERVIPLILEALKLWKNLAVRVESASANKYPVFIGKNILEHSGVLLKTLKLFPQNEMLVCTDSNIAEKQKENFEMLCNVGKAKNFVFPAGEGSKNLKELNSLWTFMLKKRYSRKTCLLQFSGGVVGDMAGFAAATYQRGVSFAQFPTTLLAMVDSSVGGKVAINHPEGKNMIGAFYQPKAVMCDLAVLETLPQEEFFAGLAEVVKYGIIYDGSFFDWLEKNADAILAKDEAALKYAVKRSCEIKAEVVGIDEHETGLRAILNYGHTFGHAIEKLTKYGKFSHGIAVGLGMRVAGRLSVITGRWSKEDEERQSKLLSKFGIPKTLKECDVELSFEDVWAAMRADKKAEKKKRIFILPLKVGEVEKTSNVEKAQIFEAWIL